MLIMQQLSRLINGDVILQPRQEGQREPSWYLAREEPEVSLLLASKYNSWTLLGVHILCRVTLDHAYKVRSKGVVND